MAGYITIRVPRQVSRIPISSRSNRLADVLADADLDEMTDAGEVFRKNASPRDQVCAAFRVTDDIVLKIQSARDFCKKSGRRFSLSALVARRFL
jgi:hypothetical protein